MGQISQRNLIVSIVSLVVVLIAVFWFWGPGSTLEDTPNANAVAGAPRSEAPAPPTDDDGSAAVSDEDPAADAADESDEAPAEPAEETTTEETANQEPANQATAGEATGTTGSRRFLLDPEQSEARFIIDEILFGDPNTVVGSTNVISGAFTVNFDDLSQTSIDPIVIDASELATDNRFRNRSLSRMILQSNRDEYQYIRFTPTAIAGMPAAPAVGETVNLEVTGDLQIRDMVAPVTFALTVTATSDTQLEGLAVTTVPRADFDLQIPDVDGVAEVAEEVDLEFEFVAVAPEDAAATPEEPNQ